MPAFLRTLIPSSTRRAPGKLLNAAEVQLAVDAINKRMEVTQVKTPLVDGISMLQEPQAIRPAQKVFEECQHAFRNELYLSPDATPIRRLALHESLMAAGFYARATNMHNPKLDSARFVVNHYNFDLRRDSSLVKAVHDSILSAHETPEADELAAELLQLERYLFGTTRLRPIEGKQYLMLGVPFSEFQDEKSLQSVLELPVLKSYGNFNFAVRDDFHTIESRGRMGAKAAQERWQVAVVSCAPELTASRPDEGVEATGGDATAASIAASGDGQIFSQELLDVVQEANLKAGPQSYQKLAYEQRFLLPPPYVPFWERVKLILLDAWVYVFGFFVAFWMIDEEIFAVLGILWARYQTKKQLEEEAKRTPGSGKVYFARSKWYL